MDATLSALYGELHSAVAKTTDSDDNRDLEKVISVANSLLAKFPTEIDAQTCKAVTMLKLGKFRDALNSFEKISSASPETDVTYEMAYCHYRINDVAGALKVLDNSLSNSNRFLELRAQVLYRLERFAESIDCFEQLLRNADDDFDNERHVNYTAALSAHQLFGQGKPGASIDPAQFGADAAGQFYELHYNLAAHAIGASQLKKAMQRLDVAEKLCREMFDTNADDETNAELADELSSIRAQKAFVLHKLGRSKEALDLNHQVLRDRPSDAGVAAVASTNIVALNRDQNVFESRRKVKMASSTSAAERLNSHQRRSVSINLASFYLASNQLEACRKALQQYQQQFGPSSLLVITEAGLYLREKRINKAIESLESYLQIHQNDIRVALVLAQVLTTQGHVFKACDVLRSLPLDTRSRLGIVATLTSFYSSQEDRQVLIDYLEEVVDYHERNHSAPDVLFSLKQRLANCLLAAGQPQKGAEVLVELRKAQPKSLSILVQLVRAYKQFDMKKADKTSKQLPSLDELAEEVDAEQILQSFLSYRPRARKRDAETASTDATAKEVATVSAAATAEPAKKGRTRKKKRKTIYPKNYDPSVPPDPERWLPLKERSYYRHRRRDRRRDRDNIGRGPQGAMPTIAELDQTLSASHQATAAPSTQPAAKPVVSKPVQKKKKKKGGKW